nr:hypothetical protein [Halobacterium sp. TGN-42-S1]
MLCRHSLVLVNCTYCGEGLAAYDPVFVDRERDGERTEEGAFCNYGCLSAWLDETEAATGACCRI